MHFITDVSRAEHFIFDCDEYGPECVTPAVVDVGADGTEVTIREGHARRPLPTQTTTPAASEDTASPSSAEASSETADTDAQDSERNPEELKEEEQ